MEKCPHDRNNESHFKKQFERCKGQKYLIYFYKACTHVLSFFVVINFNYTLGTIKIIFLYFNYTLGIIIVLFF